MKDEYYENCSHTSPIPQSFRSLPCEKDFCLNKQQCLSFAFKHHEYDYEVFNLFFRFIQSENAATKMSEKYVTYYAKYLLKIAHFNLNKYKHSSYALYQYTQALCFLGSLQLRHSLLFLNTCYTNLLKLLSCITDVEFICTIRIELGQCLFYLGQLYHDTQQNYFEAAITQFETTLKLKPTQHALNWIEYIRSYKEFELDIESEVNQQL